MAEEQNISQDSGTVDATTTPEAETQETQETQETENPEIANLKRLLSKANAEAAESKRKLREKQTEAERREAEAQEAREAEQAELQELRLQVAIQKGVEKAVENGFTMDNARRLATALSSNDSEGIYKAIADQRKLDKESIYSEMLKTSPRPEGTGSDTTEKTSVFSAVKTKAQSDAESRNIIAHYAK